jgi:8-amino-7-oxononanoate synthase
VSTPPLLHQSTIDDTLAAELADLRERDRERALRRVGSRVGAIVKSESGAAVDFSSNDYLGLASDSRLAESAARAMREQGVGAAASRLICGNNPEHEALEVDLAEFFGAERALTFSSGYAANVGIIPALVGRGDIVFSDTLNHASLIDGCRLSRADVHVYPHGDVAALAALLDQRRGSARRALIVSDGLFSMDGDVAPLADLVDLASRFDAWTYVDDAHAVGVAGRDGAGSVSAAGCAGRVDVTVGTLGKAFGAAGAFVYGSSTLVQYLINRARSFVFSTAMLPAQAAAAREAVRIVRAEPERRERLYANAERLRASLHAARIPVIGTATKGLAHIIPVHAGTEAEVMRIGAALARDRYLVGAVRPPTVPEGGSRLRITVSAAHTAEQIAGLTASLVAASRE